MFENFVLKSRRNKAKEFLTAIKTHVPEWRDDLDSDFLGYMELAEKSESHKYDPLSTIHAEVVWPMILGNYVLMREHDSPVAYASWGMFDQKISDLKLSAGRGMLSKEDYGSGSNLWLMDVIAPFGHAKAIIKILIHLKKNVSSGHVHFRRWYGDRNMERINKALC